MAKKNKGFINSSNNAALLNILMQGMQSASQSDDVGGSLLKTGLTAAGTAVGGPIGGIAGSVLGNLLVPGQEESQPINPRVQRNLNPYGMANGGMVQNGQGLVPVEVEGDEMYELPNGQVGEFQGPNHEQGGIPTQLPAGTNVYSKRMVGADGRSMADRKESREKRLRRILAQLDKRPTDAPTINAVSREVDRIQAEEEQDMQIMQMQQLSNMLAQARGQGQMQGQMSPEMQQQAMQQQMQQGQMPMMQAGGVIGNNPNNIYNKVPRKGAMTNPDGSVSTHLMAREYIPEKGWVVFPTLFQNEDESWLDMSQNESWGDTYQEAVKRNEVFEFGDDENAAIEFADKGSWKQSYQPTFDYPNMVMPRDNTAVNTPMMQDGGVLFPGLEETMAYPETLQEYQLIQSIGDSQQNQMEELNNKKASRLFNKLGNQYEKIAKTYQDKLSPLFEEAEVNNNPNMEMMPGLSEMAYGGLVRQLMQAGGKVDPRLGTGEDMANVNKVSPEVAPNQVDLIHQYHKGKGDIYQILDKAGGKRTFYRDGEELFTQPVLVGANEGDDPTITVLKPGGGVDWEAGNKMTGAGVFEVAEAQKRNPNYQNAPFYVYRNTATGKKIRSSDHAVLGSRKERLNDDDLTNNRMTNGCVNANCDDLRDVYNAGYGVGNRRYVLPEDGYNYFDMEDGEIVMKTRYTGGDLPEVTVSAPRPSVIGMSPRLVDMPRESTAVNRQTMQAGGVIGNNPQNIYNRVPRKGAMMNPDGTQSTHLMAREYMPDKGWVAFPTLFQNEDASWLDMSKNKNWQDTYKEALKRNEVFEFGDDEQAAIEFADKGNWKQSYQPTFDYPNMVMPRDNTSVNMPMMQGGGVIRNGNTMNGFTDLAMLLSGYNKMQSGGEVINFNNKEQAQEFLQTIDINSPTLTEEDKTNITNALEALGYDMTPSPELTTTQVDQFGRQETAIDPFETIVKPAYNEWATQQPSLFQDILGLNQNFLEGRMSPGYDSPYITDTRSTEVSSEQYQRPTDEQIKAAQFTEQDKVLAGLDLNPTTEEDIKKLQTALQAAGYDLGPKGVDGKLSDYTNAAIDKWKTDYANKEAIQKDLYNYQRLTGLGAATDTQISRLAATDTDAGLLNREALGEDFSVAAKSQFGDQMIQAGKTKPTTPEDQKTQPRWQIDPLTQAGYITSGAGPLITTILNRLGDEPTPNFYANYGRDAERALDAAERGIAGSRDRAFEENRLAQNLRARQARNAARSSNVMQAMQQAALTSGMKANEQITGQYQNALRSLLANRAQFEQGQDQAVMKGREAAYTADLQNRDQFSTNLASNLANVGSMMQTLGRQKEIFDIYNQLGGNLGNPAKQLLDDTESLLYPKKPKDKD